MAFIGSVAFVEEFFEAAEEHSKVSEDADHEVGDLQEVLRVAWEIMTPDQRREAWSKLQHILTWKQ